MKFYHHNSISETLDTLKTSADGLSSEEAGIRLAKYGGNTIKSAKKQNLFLKYLAQFKDVMVIILIFAAVISLVFAIIEEKSTELIDAGIIFGIVILNATLGFTQELKAENALESLKKMAKPFARVMRDGEEKKIKSDEVVIGDIILLEAGDVVPADVLLVDCASLKCDESSLTGESTAVEKTAGVVLPENTSLGDRKNMCFSSTTIVYGRALGVVVATGSNAEIGKIASLLSVEKKEITPLQKSLAKLGEIITFIVLAVAIIIFLVDIIFAHQGYMDSFMTAVAIAVAAIPESLPAIVTIILSIGVTKLAKKNAIIKKIHAVETLGCCQVICSDKTGTITQNKMTVREIFVGENFKNVIDLQNANHIQLLTCMTLCNDAKKQKNGYFGDPTETALIQFTETFDMHKKGLEMKFKRVGEIPFDSIRKLMTTVNICGNNYMQWTKGAVDELLDRCSHIYDNGEIRKLTIGDIEVIKKKNNQMCNLALRVLAYGTKTLGEIGDNEEAHNKKYDKTIEEKDLVFLGLSGMMDPPREEVYAALEECRSAGMRAVMITGDHKDTAYAIAKELGMIKSEKEVVNGNFLDKFTDKQLAKEIEKYNVFTRVSPEHKVRIVRALQANGKIVAMTGDGVNDAPSVKAANIGIGMGNVGTDVTKEVADMILADDNFATIVVAVKEGRRIFANIQKTIQFLLGCNIAEVLTVFALTLMFPAHQFLTAVQLLFINLVTDTLPSIALGLEVSEKDSMKKSPRNPKENIIGGRIGVNIVYQGIAQTLIIIGVYLMGNYVFNSNAIATSMAFLTINFIQLFHMYNVRTTKSIFAENPFRNTLLNLAFIFEFIFLLSVSLIPAVANIFGIFHLSFLQWLTVFAGSMLIVPVCEIVKIFQRKKDRKFELSKKD
ncbi:MAG: cation-translocating P-type ATPase [Clostridia bacterium]|nr:cation-translocating P-type ATPase [Clostridia bacterium]